MGMFKSGRILIYIVPGDKQTFLCVKLPLMYVDFLPPTPALQKVFFDQSKGSSCLNIVVF